MSEPIEIIEAAGAVVPRKATTGALEICLVHRPKYNDWSFPKGKVEAHESLAHAAVREVGEETGISIRLTSWLAEVSYPLHADGSEGTRSKSRKAGKHRKRLKKSKHVVYWIGAMVDAAAASARQEAFGAPIQHETDDETDIVEWLSLSDAIEKLTYDSDRDVLKLFAQQSRIDHEQAADEQEVPNSATVILVRHGKAESRKYWTGTDQNRPLTPKGAGESFALARELACFGVTRLVSSPWTRCTQTLVPYAVATHCDIENAEELTEDAAEKRPEAAVDSILSTLKEAAADPDSPTAVCVHRPVLGTLLPQLAKYCVSESIAEKLPEHSPYLQTAYGLALSVSLDNDEPAITAVQEVGPIEY